MAFVDGTMASAMAYSLPVTVRLAVIAYWVGQRDARREQSTRKGDGAEDSGEGSRSDLHVFLQLSLLRALQC